MPVFLSKHWNDVILLLLTAAIAWTGWRQAVTAEKQDTTARNVLRLQETIEKKHTQVNLFLRMKSYQPVGMGASSVGLQIANLSEVGIWPRKSDSKIGCTVDATHEQISRYASRKGSWFPQY